MTFDPNVPNASQSPGVFPAQNNANFLRLKQIIENDHVFNDTQNTATDGVHKQCTMIARSPPVGVLPMGTSGILFTYVDSNTQNQLAFYNGTDTFNLTPITSTAPTMINGMVTLASQATSGIIFAIPPRTFFTIYLAYTSDPGDNYFGVYRSSIGNSSFSIKSLDSTGPRIVTTGNNLKIKNNTPAAPVKPPKDIEYFIITSTI